MLSADASLAGALPASPVENAVQQPAAYIGFGTTDSDKSGQVKVQFHWDRDGQQQDNSSCWIRVSQPHSGAGGDPDLPLITGRIYNAAAESPAALNEAFADFDDDRMALVSFGPAPTESGEKGGTEDINIGVGELQECTISKSMDRATTMLAQHAINGNSLGQAEILFVETAGGGQDGMCYLQYKLDRCFVKSWSTSGDADDRPTEEVAFYYNKIAFQYASTQDGAAR